MQRKRRGTALVQTAFVLPVIVIMLLGIVEYGRYYFINTVLYNAAREGARFGAIQPTNTTGITAAARQFVAGLGGAAVNVAVATPQGTAHGDPITVSVSYTTGLLIPGYTKRLALVRSSTMLIE